MAQLRWLDWLAPDFKAIHPVGAQLPLECIAIMSASFLAARFQTTYNVPTYEAWLATQDMRPAYAFHRRFLQHLDADLAGGELAQRDHRGFVAIGIDHRRSARGELARTVGGGQRELFGIGVPTEEPLGSLDAARSEPGRRDEELPVPRLCHGTRGDGSPLRGAERRDAVPGERSRGSRSIE